MTMIHKFLWYLKGVFEDMANGFSYEEDKRYTYDEYGIRHLDENYHRP
jgi:hypothetical protein